MPLLSDQVSRVDAARMAFIDALGDHVAKLREELRISELILHSVVKSLSAQDDAMAQLDSDLHAVRAESHRPHVLTKQQDKIIAQVEDALREATNTINNEDK